MQETGNVSMGNIHNRINTSKDMPLSIFQNIIIKCFCTMYIGTGKVHLRTGNEVPEEE
jgi:hypothetical protein